MAEFLWPVRVYYEDTDLAGVVYYANYLKFLERARTEWLRACGFEQDTLKQVHKRVFVVRHISLDYHKPALFNDTLLISVQVLKAGPASLLLAQQVYRDGICLCDGQVKIASVNANTLRPATLPATMREVLHPASR